MLDKGFTAISGGQSVLVDWGTALEWNIIFTAALSGLIVACITVSVIVYRRRQTDRNAMWLHLLALCIFPLLLLPFGNFAVFEYSRQERFCASCHLAMQPYIDDLHRKDGRSLAALHYQDRFAPGEECYSCHADYEIHGTFEAKLLGLRDAYREFTHTYTARITMRPPFTNTLCLKCHNGARNFVGEDSHLDSGNVVAEALRTGNVACTECHGSGHRISETTKQG